MIVIFWLMPQVLQFTLFIQIVIIIVYENYSLHQFRGTKRAQSKACSKCIDQFIVLNAHGKNVKLMIIIIIIYFIAVFG